MSDQGSPPPTTNPSAYAAKQQLKLLAQVFLNQPSQNTDAPAPITTRRSSIENRDSPLPAPETIETSPDGLAADQNSPDDSDDVTMVETSLNEDFAIQSHLVENNINGNQAARQDQVVDEPASQNLFIDNTTSTKDPVIKSEQKPWQMFSWNEDIFAQPNTDQDSEQLYTSNLFRSPKSEPEDANIKMEDLPESGRSASSLGNRRKDVISIPDDDEAIELSDCEDEDMVEISDDEDKILPGTIDDHFVAELNCAINEHDLPVKKKATKPRRKPAKTAKDAHLRRQWDERNKQLKRGKPRKHAAKQRNTTKEISAKSSKNSKRKDARPGGPGLLQLFTNYNPFVERDTNDNEPAPNIIASTKKTQLDRFIENCPEGGDMHKARCNKADLDRASKRFGRAQITAKDGKWLLNGMKSALYNHQLIGVDFMLEREFSNDGEFQDGPSGGILCDAMGLGKTVEVFATMVANRPDMSIPGECKTTLIIVPASVIRQWKNEIKKHCEPHVFPRSMIYKASQANDIDVFTLTTHDIVLATYHALMESCPYPSKEMAKEFREQDRKQKKAILKDRSKRKRMWSMVGMDDETATLEAWIENNREIGGYLHQIEWYRIVLDEAHMIKNHLSRTSLAANALMGKYRWAVSGTPIMNRLEEFYSYFRFLSDPATASFLQFQGDYCDFKDKDCRSALETKLSHVLIRRTMNDKILERPIIQLPTPHEQILKLKQPPAERVLYRAIEERMRELINERYKKKDPRKKLTYFFPQMTRIRQLTAHPLLIERPIKMMFNRKQLEEIAKDLRRLREKIPTLDMTIHDQITNWVGEKLIEGDVDDLFNTPNVPPCGICYDDLMAEDEPRQILKCKHIFCKPCLDGHIDSQIGEGDEVPICPTCFEEFDIEKVKDYHVRAEDDDDQITSYADTMKGKDSLKFRPRGMKSSRWLDRADDSEIKLLQSAKMKALKMQLRQWNEEGPTEKIIIFSQWRLFCTVIGRILSDLGIGFVYFTGDMNSRQREAAIGELEEKPEVRAMVSGLKCGGLGLNLTFASRVISIDLWWNCCIENQAFGRVYRIGQERETYFTRFMIRKTIDDRIYKLQVKKMAIIDGTLQDLSDEEMAGLLGRVEKDAAGNIQISADYEDYSDHESDIDLDE